MCRDSQCPVKEHCLRSPVSGMPVRTNTCWFLGSPRQEEGCVLFEPDGVGGIVAFEGHESDVVTEMET